MRLFQISKTIFSTLLITLITLFCAEGIGAVYYYSKNPITRPPIFGGPQLLTNRYLDSFGFDPISLYSNTDIPLNEGLWAREIIKLPPKAKGEFRIFLTGGSTVANIRMPPGERIADHLQDALQEAGVQARVFNFGVPSYTSYNELALISGKLLYEKPDLIISYNGVNDVFYGAALRPEIWRPNMADTLEHYWRRFHEDIQHILSPFQRLNYLLDGVSYSKYLVQELLIANKTTEIYDMRRYTARDWANKLATNRVETCNGALPIIRSNPTFSSKARENPTAMDAYVNNVMAISIAAHEAEITFVHVLQPTAFSKKKLYPCEKYSIDYNNTAYQGIQEIWLETYAQLSQKFSKLNNTNNPYALHIDLSHFTDAMDTYLFDGYAHAWARGPLTRLIGQELSRQITPLIRPMRDKK